jgi:hypothetical protein
MVFFIVSELSRKWELNTHRRRMCIEVGFGVSQIEDNLPQALALFELSGCYDRKTTFHEMFGLH